MTGCEILVVLTLINYHGKPSAISVRPVIPAACHARVRFRASPPLERTIPLCPVVRSG